MIENTVTHVLAFGLAGRRMMQGDTMRSFVAIDFETANHERDSACAVGLVTGRDGRIERVRSFLIRPPSTQFVFTDIHGLRWEDVRGAPTFGELWPALRAGVDSTAFIATHNAPFDRSVLSRRAVRCTASRCRGRRSPAPSSLRARSGTSTRRGCLTCAVGSASRYVTTTRRPTPKRVRVSCWPPSERDGGSNNTFS